MTQELHRGEVWWATVPGDKTRPVLLLTREPFVPHLSTLLVAPITTTVRSIPTEVPLGVDDGLPRSCAANFDNVFTLHRSRFERFIGRLGDDRMGEVCRAYRFAAGC
ncbi:MAG: type II toxin-antitoxin system PemK/MazF family toxin, partial [Actinomycetota bacterium]|nr:type II toxin-antitoxin system PemK/MazF family toxin [Actinomycetota bacterium]